MQQDCKMLYESGAQNVHVRIACPEIKYPDFYGIDMPTKEELLAYNKNLDEMCNYIKARTLKFLSLDGLYIALTDLQDNLHILNLVTIILLEIILLNLLTILKVVELNNFLY